MCLILCKVYEFDSCRCLFSALQRLSSIGHATWRVRNERTNERSALGSAVGDARASSKADVVNVENCRWVVLCEGMMAGTAATTGVLRPRSALHNCVSSTSSRAGASVSFADDEVITDPKPQRGNTAGICSTVNWVVERAPRGLGAQAALAGAVVVVGYQLAVGDISVTVHRACAVAVTVFSVSCSFCALALRLRRSWTNTAAYSLFATCCGVELALGHALTSADNQNSASSVTLHPLLTVGVLTTAGVVCVLSPLDAVEGVLVVGLVNVARYLAGTMLVDVPCSLRPLLTYGGGLAGVIAARYIETTLVQSSNSVSGTSGVVASATGKRRRASASATNNYSSHAAARRVSLPTLVHKSLVCYLRVLACSSCSS